MLASLAEQPIIELLEKRLDQRPIELCAHTSTEIPPGDPKHRELVEALLARVGKVLSETCYGDEDANFETFLLSMNSTSDDGYRWLAITIGYDESICEAIQDVLSEGEQNSDNVANIIYRLTSENNFTADVPEICNEIAKKLYNRMVDKDNLRINEDDLPDIIGRVGGFILETVFAYEDKVNGWSYAADFCKTFIEMMLDSEIGSKLVTDIFKYAQESRVLYPPQIYYIFLQLNEKYGLGCDYPNLLKQYYQDNSSLFDNFPELNISVSGMQRPYEIAQSLPEIREILGPQSTLIAPFSGPIPPHIHEARIIGAGKLTTIDTKSQSELGEALLISNELASQDSVKYDYPDITGIEHQHVQTPIGSDEGNEQLRNLLLKAGECGSVMYDDSRGSVLYMDPDKRLDYLKLLFKTFNELNDVNIVFRINVGISNKNLHDLVIARKDGEWRVISIKTGLSNFLGESTAQVIANLSGLNISLDNRQSGGFGENLFEEIMRGLKDDRVEGFQDAGMNLPVAKPCTLPMVLDKNDLPDQTKRIDRLLSHIALEIATGKSSDNLRVHIPYQDIPHYTAIKRLLETLMIKGEDEFNKLIQLYSRILDILDEEGVRSRSEYEGRIIPRASYVLKGPVMSRKLEERADELLAQMGINCHPKMFARFGKLREVLGFGKGIDYPGKDDPYEQLYFKDKDRNMLRKVLKLVEKFDQTKFTEYTAYLFGLMSLTCNHQGIIRPWLVHGALVKLKDSLEGSYELKTAA